MIEHHEIEKYIPHRHPFLLVDRVLEIESKIRIVAQKNVTGSEYFFSGHFPGQPVMPGVLIIEALAQSASILAAYSLEELRDKLIFFAGIDKARFKRPVLPGDTLRLYCKTIKIKSRLIKVAARAEVDGKIVTEAELTAMVAR